MPGIPVRVSSGYSPSLPVTPVLEQVFRTGGAVYADRLPPGAQIIPPMSPDTEYTARLPDGTIVRVIQPSAATAAPAGRGPVIPMGDGLSVQFDGDRLLTNVPPAPPPPPAPMADASFGSYGAALAAPTGISGLEAWTPPTDAGQFPYRPATGVQGAAAAVRPPSPPPPPAAAPAAAPAGLPKLSFDDRVKQMQGEYDTILAKGRTEGREEDFNMALLRAGLGMAASQSPSFLAALAEGGMQGVNAFEQGRNRREARAEAAASRGVQFGQLARQSLRDEQQTEQWQRQFDAGRDEFREQMALRRDEAARQAAQFQQQLNATLRPTPTSLGDGGVGIWNPKTNTFDVVREPRVQASSQPERDRAFLTRANLKLDRGEPLTPEEASVYQQIFQENYGDREQIVNGQQVIARRPAPASIRSSENLTPIGPTSFGGGAGAGGPATPGTFTTRQSLASDGSAAPGAPAAPSGQVPAASAAPPRQTTTTVGLSADDRKALRAADQEAERLSNAIQGVRDALAQDPDAISAWMNNPRDPKAQRFNQAIEIYRTALRSENLINTGVLQPGETAMLDQMILDPKTWRGAMASPEAREAAMNEWERFLKRNVASMYRSRGQTVPDRYVIKEDDGPPPPPGTVPVVPRR
jgi:hypothetical protein